MMKHEINNTDQCNFTNLMSVFRICRKEILNNTLYNKILGDRGINESPVLLHFHFSRDRMALAGARNANALA